MPRDETILLDIARAARLVLEFKQGIGKAAFLKDIKTAMYPRERGAKQQRGTSTQSRSVA